MSYETKQESAELDTKESIPSSGDVHVVERERDSREPQSLKDLSEEEILKMKKTLVRRIDLIILPLIAILYILNYIDRQALGVTKVQGIMEDLNLTTAQFATCISILFVGYLPFQIPSNLIITKVARPGLYICCFCIIWGGVSASCSAVKNYTGLVTVRAFLGVVEAPFFAGVIYYLSAWYTKQELGKRIAGLYIAQQVGNAFGGLFAAAVLSLNNVHGLKGWQWLFIIEGSATVGIGAIAAFFMPEYPHNCRMLTPIQRDLAVWRLESESGAAEGTEEVSTMKSFRLAFRDPKVYMLIFMNMMSGCQGSIANFFPSIVGSLGYNSTLTLVLTAPPYIFAGFMYYGISWYSDRKHTVYPIILCLIGIACAMYIISMSTLNIGARYFAMMMLPFSSVGPQILLYKTINLHVARPVAKRAAASALVSAIGGTSNIWMSYLYINPPSYFPAFGALLGAAALFAATLTLYRWYVLDQNKKLDSGDPRQIAAVLRTGVTQEMVDMGWRYEMF